MKIKAYLILAIFIVSLTAGLNISMNSSASVNELNYTEKDRYDTTDQYTYASQPVDDLLYLADQEDGLRILNISDAQNPYEVARYDTAIAYDVHVDGNITYLAADQYFYILNTSDVSNIDTIAQIMEPGRNLVVNQDHVFLSYLTEVKIIDVSTLTNPTLVYQWFLPYRVGGMAANDSYLYTALENQGFKLYDISTINNPQLISSLDYSDPNDHFNYPTPEDIIKVNDTVFVGDANTKFGVIAIDIVDKNNPVELGRYNTSINSRSMTYTNNTIFSSSGSTVHVLNFTDKTSPTLHSTYETAGVVHQSYQNHSLFLSRMSQGLSIVDTSNLTNLVHIVDYDLETNRFSDVDVWGGYIFGVSILDGLYKFDSSSNQLELEHIFNISSIQEFVIVNNYGYLIGDQIYVINLFNNTVIDTIKHDTYTDYTETASYGDYLYVYDTYSFSILVLDTSDPEATSLSNTANIGVYAKEMSISNDKLFVGDISISVYNLANPSNPSLVTTYYPETPSIDDMTTHDDLLFYGQGDADKFYIMNFSNPTNPITEGQIDTSSGSLYHGYDDMYYHDGRLYFEDNGIGAIDVSDPSNPVEIPIQDRFASFTDMQIVGGHVYVSHDTNGVAIYQWQELPPTETVTVTDTTTTTSYAPTSTVTETITETSTNTATETNTETNTETSTSTVTETTQSNSTTTETETETEISTDISTETESVTNTQPGTTEVSTSEVTVTTTENGNGNGPRTNTVTTFLSSLTVKTSVITNAKSEATLNGLFWIVFIAIAPILFIQRYRRKSR